MISNKMTKDSLLEEIVFDEVMKELKLDRMWKFEFFFMKRVAKNFGFWSYVTGNDWEDL